jgi:hypothetical protein
MGTVPDRPVERCGSYGLWRSGTRRQRAAAVAVGIALAVLVELAVLEPALRAVAAVALLAVLAAAASAVREDLRRQQRICGEAAEGVRQLERWLASGERA